MKITPTSLMKCLERKGYNAYLSAPFIANTYCNSKLHKFEKQTLKDIKDCIKQFNHKNTRTLQKL